MVLLHFFLHSISFVHSACCVTCGLTQSEWRKRGVRGEVAERIDLPTENIAITAVKAVSPRRLHLTALAVSKTRLNIYLREIANLWRIKRIKRITRLHWRALRMAWPFGFSRKATETLSYSLKSKN